MSRRVMRGVAVMMNAADMRRRARYRVRSEHDLVCDTHDAVGVL